MDRQLVNRLCGESRHIRKQLGKRLLGGNAVILCLALLGAVGALVGCKQKVAAPVVASGKTTAEEQMPDKEAAEGQAAKEQVTENLNKQNAEQPGNAASSASSNDVDAAGTAAKAESAEKEVTSTEPKDAAAAMASKPEVKWTTQRIVALADSGPIVFDLAISLDGDTLEGAALSATQRAVAQLEKDIEKPWTWEKLLDHPLVRSGWLGNLVPEEDQKGQLISMYNTDGDDEVDMDEIAPFLTRGLSKGPALRFKDIGRSPNAIDTKSPWEQLDANGDSLLSKEEIAMLAQSTARYDLNADHVVTIQEVQSNRAAMNDSMGGRASMLSTKSGIAPRPDEKPKQFAKSVMEHYTSLPSVSRDQWQGWSDAAWKEFDANSDGTITISELERLLTVKANAEFRVQLQIATSGEPQVTSVASSTSDLKWASRRAISGQATGSQCVLSLQVNDGYGAANRAVLRRRLAEALARPQVAEFFRTQLQLSEQAFDVLDADGDKKLSDGEFENAWLWLTAIRGSRIGVRWMIADSAWFRLGDLDADGRLTELEVKSYPENVARFDRDGDQSISPGEIPLMVRLEVDRTDDRLGANAFVAATEESSPSNWFGAMDVNADNVVSNLEFLGTSEDFAQYDGDNDGFISREEAYKVNLERVQ